jgi:hypothetical protein
MKIKINVKHTKKCGHLSDKETPERKEETDNK